MQPRVLERPGGVGPVLSGGTLVYPRMRYALVVTQHQTKVGGQVLDGAKETTGRIDMTPEQALTLLDRADLSLRLQDGRVFNFSLGDTSGRIVAKSGGDL